jgi:polyisoprenyl-teichoic acid--peptidoglycan teichoic acid transferase
MFLKQSRAKKFVLVFSFVLAVLACVTAAGFVALKYWHPLRESGVLPSSSQPSSQPRASSSAASSQPQWSGDFTNFLICGIDNTNSLTDVIMIASFDNKTKKISILQIPRDTYAGVDVPSHKYNAVYGHHDKGVSGMETLRARVERDFGIKIGNYAAVTTKGLRKIVDAAGGVDIDVPINMNYDDKQQNLHIHLKKGKQHLDGSGAEQFVRYRKGWTQGDLGRLDAQKIFLAAFAQKLKSLGVWRLGTKILPVVSPPDFLTDMSALDIISLWGSAKNVSFSNATVYTMPGEPYTGSDGAALYSVHKKELLKILNKDFVPTGVSLTLDDLGIIQKANIESSASGGSNFDEIINKSK